MNTNVKCQGYDLLHLLGGEEDRLLRLLHTHEVLGYTEVVNRLYRKNKINLKSTSPNTVKRN